MGSRFSRFEAIGSRMPSIPAKQVALTRHIRAFQHTKAFTTSSPPEAHNGDEDASAVESSPVDLSKSGATNYINYRMRKAALYNKARRIRGSKGDTGGDGDGDFVRDLVITSLKRRNALERAALAPKKPWLLHFEAGFRKQSPPPPASLSIRDLGDNTAKSLRRRRRGLRGTGQNPLWKTSGSGNVDPEQHHQMPIQKRQKNRSTFMTAAFELNAALKKRQLELFGSGTAKQQLNAIHSRSVFGREIQRLEEALWSALRTSQPQAVVEALKNLTDGAGAEHTGTFLQSLAPTTFSEILRSMDPAYVIKEYDGFLSQLSPWSARALGVTPSDDGSFDFCVRFLAFVHTVVQLRLQTSPPSLLDLKYLLKVARLTGQANAAQRIWDLFTKSPRLDNHVSSGRYLIVPDVECYNHLMAAKLYKESMNVNQRYFIRVTPAHLLLRQWPRLPYRLGGHHVQSKVGIKSQVSFLFQEMINKKLFGNEETFCLLITALAREGDITGVSSILKRIWGIDVSDLATGEPDSFRKTCSPGSPTYPSERLLSTISHVYGTNNDIPTALRLVDFVSRQYDIPIPRRVWKDLFMWTYVLSRRSTERLPDGKRYRIELGRLPPEAVSNIWNTMVSEPYNVLPTLELYNYLISDLLQKRQLQAALIHMRVALKMHKKNVSHYSRLFISVGLLDRSRSSSSYIQDRENELVYKKLCLGRDKEYIRRWVRLYLFYARITWRCNPERFVEHWTWQILPKFLNSEFRFFLPEDVRYPVEGGKVELHMKTRNATWMRHRKMLRMGGESRRRRLQNWVDEERELEEKVRSTSEDLGGGDQNAVSGKLSFRKIEGKDSSRLEREKQGRQWGTSSVAEMQKEDLASFGERKRMLQEAFLAESRMVS